MRIQEAIERPRQYWIEDGVAELALGLLSFFTGAIFWLGQTLSGSTFAEIYTIAAPCVCGVVWAASIWWMKRLKERVVVPRAGYVTVSESARLFSRNSIGMAKVNFSSKALPLAIVGFFGAWAFMEARDRLWLRDPNRWGAIIALSLAIWLAVCFVLAAMQFKARRYLPVAALALAVGVTYGRGNDPALDLMIMMTWLGGAFVLIGAWRFNKFLASNPPVEDGRE